MERLSVSSLLGTVRNSYLWEPLRKVLLRELREPCALHLRPLLDGGRVLGLGRVEVVLLHGPAEPLGNVGAAPVGGV